MDGGVQLKHEESQASCQTSMQVYVCGVYEDPDKCVWRELVVENERLKLAAPRDRRRIFFRTTTTTPSIHTRFQFVARIHIYTLAFSPPTLAL